MERCSEKLERGLELHHAGRFVEAEALYREVLAEDPKNADALCLIGVIAQQVREFDQAADYLCRAIDIEPSVPDYHNNLGVVYRTLHRLDEAIAHYRQAIALKPEYGAARSNLAIALQENGQTEEALKELNQALEIDPTYASPYFHLAEIRRYRPGDPLKARIEELIRNPDLSAKDRSILHYAMAKIYDDCDEFEKAFAHAKKANDLDHNDFDIKDRAELVVNSQAVFTKNFFEKRGSFGSDSELPIFVTGMPRCGKSLVEHIVNCHPDTFGAGELRDVYRIAAGLPALLGTELGYPQCLEQLDQEIAVALADAHVEYLQELGGEARRVIDTVPGNSLRVGLIALLFPKARVIHCRRHPLDSGLAIYMKNMNDTVAFASDLTHIGQFYNLHEKLMDHWKREVPMNILDVQYEELVADPEKVCREIIDHCGLDWDDRCLATPYRARPVRTDDGAEEDTLIDPSFVGRWRHYERFLAPLKAALGESAG